MPNVPPFESLPESIHTTLRSLVRSATRGPLQAVGFWTGVFAPLAYPLLLVGDLTEQSLVVLFGVVVLNVCGLLLGRGYSNRS